MGETPNGEEPANQYPENEIIRLKNEINILKNENDYLKKLLFAKNNYDKEEQNNIINNLKEEINNLKFNLNIKEKDIIYLKAKLLKFEPSINVNDNIVLNFMCKEQNINYSISCNSEEIFVNVEERLYEKINAFRNTNNILICNGKIILRFKKLCENKIGNGDTIQIYKPW